MKTPKNPTLLQLKKLLPPGELSFDPAVLQAHSGDKWYATSLPEAVAFPSSTESVSRLLTYCNQHQIPVTPRGAGYGYVGGCVPVRSGVALSLIKMNRILEINREDFVAVVQPGVLTEQLQNRVEAKGLYYPPDPASKANCSLGGNIATNAGGPRCLKYGVTRDYVLGLEVVLADGTICRLGGRTHKNKTGFELARLFVGSEGMLGVVTEATLKLLPLPPYRACLGVGFDSPQTAARALGAIFAHGVLPSALEIADEFTLKAATQLTGTRIFKGCQAYLIVELDGQEASVKGELKSLEAIINKFKPVNLQRGLGTKGCEKFWKLRREFSAGLRGTGLTKLNEDIVVPRSKLVALFSFAEKLQKKHGFAVACFGHAGDGNIHVNIMYDRAEAGADERADQALDDLFHQVVSWNGAITGEHGIGLAKRRWFPLATSEAVQQLHRTVKEALDPAGILNPDKFV